MSRLPVTYIDLWEHPWTQREVGRRAQEAQHLLKTAATKPMHSPQKPGPPDMEAMRGFWASQSLKKKKGPSLSSRRVKSRRLQKQVGRGECYRKRRRPQTQVSPPVCTGTHFGSMCTREETEKAFLKRTARGHVAWGKRSPTLPWPQWSHRESRHVGKIQPRAKAPWPVRRQSCEDITAPRFGTCGGWCWWWWWPCLIMKRLNTLQDTLCPKAGMLRDPFFRKISLKKY